MVWKSKPREALPAKTECAPPPAALRPPPPSRRRSAQTREGHLARSVGVQNADELIGLARLKHEVVRLIALQRFGHLTGDRELAVVVDTRASLPGREERALAGVAVDQPLV